MKASFVSTAAVSQAMRYSMQRAQTDLVDAQKEMATLKVADTGLALGVRTAQVINFQRDMDRLNGIVDSNSLVTSRLSSTQKSLQNLSDTAQEFLSNLSAATSGDANPDVLQKRAQATLATLSSVLNTSMDGQYLFSGTNTDVKPLNSFSDAGSPAKAAFDAAFQAHFGFSQNSAGAANITAAQMETFMTDVVEPQFLGSGWQANWSNASDQPIVGRIALNETTETSVSANNDGVRKLAMAAATLSDLFSSNLSAAGKEALTTRAVALVGDAISDLADLQAQTGIIEKRVADASTRIKLQADLFEKHLLGLEGVDPTEAATRVSDLLTHIETSYALTARIQQLSLLKYLS